MTLAGLATLRLDGVDVAVIVGCLIAGALFKAAETALQQLHESHLQDLVTEAHRRSRPGLLRLLTLWQERPDQVMTAIVLGSHAVQLALVLGLAVILAASAVALTAPVALLLGVVGLVGIVVVELIARALARERPELTVTVTFPIVWTAWFLSWPVVMLLTKLSRFSGALVGGRGQAMGPSVTEDDIAAMIELGSRSGTIDRVEGRMLTSVMELGETLVREVMVPRTDISALPIDATWDEVMVEVREEGHSRLPVYEGTLDDIRGFFHTRDLLGGDIDPVRFRLRQHLRPVEFVPELGRVRDLLRTFQRKKTHLAVVVDEFGGTAGIVALEDVLEEIVGPIQDEHDDEEAPITKTGDGSYQAEGRASLYDLAEALGVEFPDGGYDTLGGFLIARAGRMPRTGDHLGFAGHIFTVVEADERRVSRVGIERTASGATLPPLGSPADHPPPGVEVLPSDDHP